MSDAADILRARLGLVDADEGGPGPDASARPPEPTRVPRRRVRPTVLIVAASIVLYAVVVTLYAFSGHVAEVGGPADRAEPGGVVVLITPRSVDAAGESIDMDVQLAAVSPQLLSSDGFTLRTPVHVVVSPVRGNQAVTFPAGELPSTISVQLFAPGSIEEWPFDRYRAPDMTVVAFTGNPASSTPISTIVRMDGYLPGWNIDPQQNPTSGARDQIPTIDVRAARSGSTVAFGIVLLALMVAMPCLVLFVAINALRGRRKLEPSFMSWMGAMLFATIPLRTFLPGAPPIGSWIDYTIVLWVVAGLIAGLVIYVAAWWRWGRPADQP